MNTVVHLTFINSSINWCRCRNSILNFFTGFTPNTATQQQTPAVAPGATTTPAVTPAATGYNTAGYTQPQGFNQQYAQGYWGQYGYGQGWTQVSDTNLIGELHN